MFDELEALVGHIYVVGGRAVSATPPGALVELPPKKAQRGREQDTFFTLVTPAGANQGQATFYEQLARLAADLYFRTSGSVTSGLREAIGVVNNNLIEHNVVAGQRYEANMICLVLRGREVYLARAGACLCLFRQGESFITLPDDLRDEYALNALPLGYSPVADIKLSHYEVAPGQVMLLGDSGFAQAQRDELSAALGAGDIQAVIEPLKSLGGNKAQAILIEFVSVDTPDPTVQSPQPGSRITRSSAAPSATPAAPLSATGKPLTAPKPVVAERELKRSPQKSTPIANKRQSEPVGSPQPVALATSSEAVAEPVPPISEIAAETAQNATRAGRKAVGGAASFLGTLTRVLGIILDRLLPEPDENGPRIPTMLAAAVAILIPVVIVFAVVAINFAQVDVTNFETMVSAVVRDADQAQAIPLTDVNHAKTAWLGVLQRIDQVESSTGRTGDATLEQIRGHAQGVLDNYSKVTRRTATAMREFTDAAKLVGPIVQGGTSMYTLDLNADAIYRDTLNPSKNTVETRNTQPVVQQGQAVGTHTVKQMVDIIWLPEGGVTRTNVIAALDTQGILITYSPTFAPAESQVLQGAERWVKPVAVASWQRRLYMLDPGANQIWRYIDSGDSYPDPPEPYFDNDVDLQKAVDLAIDTTGNVYVLFSDGKLKRYTTGSEQIFTFNGMPDGGLKSASAMFLDTDSPLPAIYIADPLDQSVYKVTLSGTFLYRFRATDSGAFKHITGVYADHDNVYVSSGPLIYTFSTSDINVTPTPKP